MGRWMCPALGKGPTGLPLPEPLSLRPPGRCPDPPRYSRDPTADSPERPPRCDPRPAAALVGSRVPRCGITALGPGKVPPEFLVFRVVR